MREAAIQPTEKPEKRVSTVIVFMSINTVTYLI